jgi:hypothetical protein
MIFRQMNQKDVEYMKNHSVSRGILKNQPDNIDFCYALEHEGKLLGIGGLRLINPTTAWCWVDMSDNAEGHIITVYRTIKKWMYEFVELKKIKRLQAYIEPDFPKAVRMAQHLGFYKESIMTKFIGDKDAYLYVRIF